MSKQKSFITIGLATFSMFFGSGNLVFPLFIGQISQNNWFMGTIGFLVSAVLLPFLGIMTMTYFKGDYYRFFGPFGKVVAHLLIAILLSSWIPFGSFPRCTSVAYAALSSYFPEAPLWLFSSVYTIIIYFIVAKKGRFLDILGNFLTPLLLCCLSVLISVGIYKSGFNFSITSFSKGSLIFKGLIEGYNTQDLIAACFFSASIIKIIQNNSYSSSSDEKCETNFNGNANKSELWLAFKSCCVGIIILAFVYLGMIYLAALYSPSLQNISKEQLLPYISNLIIGKKFGLLTSLAIFLACITTSSALLMVFSEYLRGFNVSFISQGKRPIILTLIFSYFISLLGFEKICNMTSLFMQYLYPVLILFVLINFFRNKKNSI